MASAVVLRAMGPAALVAVLAVSSPAVLAQSKDAEPATREANAAVLNDLPFSDRQDFEDARRGFLAALPDGLIAGPGATPIWNMKRYGFLGRVKIYAPDGFMEHAVAENVIAGNAMSRSAQYMYGPLLPSGEKGKVDTGL